MRIAIAIIRILVVLLSCRTHEKETYIGYIIFLKDTSLHFNPFAFITADETERVNALEITQADMPNGYYIYDEDDEILIFKKGRRLVKKSTLIMIAILCLVLGVIGVYHIKNAKNDFSSILLEEKQVGAYDKYKLAITDITVREDILNLCHKLEDEVVGGHGNTEVFIARLSRVFI